MKQLTKCRLGVLSLAGLVLLGWGLGMISAPSGSPNEVLAQTKGGKTATDRAEAAPPQSPANIALIPPPADVNDLSMEVSALRTLYLMKVWPDQGLRRAPAWPAVETNGQERKDKDGKVAKVTDKRERKPADISKNRLKLLTDLRAAFITGQEDRINELSDQLETLDMNEDESPELDDAVEITDAARSRTSKLVFSFFSTTNLNAYISAYGKDFPDPWWMLMKVTRGDGKGEKPTADVRKFTIKEVSWQIAGLSLAKQNAVAKKVEEVLDKAETMSNKETKESWKKGSVGLRAMVNAITSTSSGFDLIRHVMEQDTAELLSNPRLLPAMQARKDYLKKAGYSLDRNSLDIDKPSTLDQ